MPAQHARYGGVIATDTLHWSNADVEVHRLVVGPYENNVFVVRCRHTGDAVLIDAANEHEKLLDLCQKLGVRRVLETHGHWDHIQAVPALREAGYDVAVTEADAAMLPSYDSTIDDDDVIEVGRLRLRSHHTPGHTPGHIALFRRGDRVLITGDALLTMDVNSPAGFVAREPRISPPPRFTSWEWPLVTRSLGRLARLQPTLIVSGHGVPMAGAGIADELAGLAERMRGRRSGSTAR